MASLGIDIGGSSVKVTLWSQDRWGNTGQSAPYKQPTLAQLRHAIRFAAATLAGAQGIGLCVPGIFDSATGALTHCVNIPALVGVRLDEFLAEALALPVPIALIVCSDAIAGARDIYVSRGLRGRLFALSLGTGVGCGVLDGAQYLNVDEGSSGHFGQVDVSIAGHDVIGPDGGAGGLEGYIGARALRRAYPGTLPEILASLTPEDPPILALVRALRIAHAIYRPQHLCLCGGVGVGLAALLPAIRRGVETDLTRIARPGWTLTCGDDAFHAARGAARIAATRHAEA